MSILSQLPSWLKNKYFLATAAFLSWMLFFDHNNIFLQRERSKELSELKNSRAYYREQIETTRAEVENVRINPLSLEKIAREKYMMKKDNEDVFIVDAAPENN